MTGDRRYTVGIIGYGKVGRIRRAVIDADPRLSLIALSDVVHDGDMADGVPIAADWRTVVAAKPDLVFVCVPNVFMPQIVAAALDAGIHTFCEKPPGRTVADTLTMQAAEARNPGLVLKFGFNHRYHASVLAARARLAEGDLGRVLWMRGVYGKAGGPAFDQDWRTDPAVSGGGILLDQGIHMLDLMRVFAGADFVDVQSFVDRLHWDTPVEDNAFALLRTAGRTVAMLHSSATQWQHRFALDVYLEHGFMELRGLLTPSETYAPETLRVARCLRDDQGYPTPNPDATVSTFPEDRSWALEVADFLSVVDGRTTLVDGSSGDALAVMDLVHRIYDQAI